MTQEPLDVFTYSPNTDGIYVLNTPAVHRDDEYEQAGFDMLVDMQSRHFWYVGRHRFLMCALQDQLRSAGANELSAIDLGGGCGGWIRYLHERSPRTFGELALADSSLRALELARQVVGPRVGRYQIDLLKLGWQSRWDAAFLLDVLEHIPNDREALVQIKDALKPGGLLFITTPALRCFWSYNDDIAHHVRRYSRDDFKQLAEASGLRLLRSRYFMFFLSPLLWLSRLKRPNLDAMSADERNALIARTHRVPAVPMNQLLKMIFNLETPLGLRLPFPWGTSILGIFQRPS